MDFRRTKLNVYGGAQGVGLSREPMRPMSSIAAELARMPGGHDGGRRSFRLTPLMKPINRQLSGVGVKKI